MTSFDDFLLEQVRAKDREIAALRYELAVRRVAMGDDPSELRMVECEETVQ